MKGLFSESGNGAASVDSPPEHLTLNFLTRRPPTFPHPEAEELCQTGPMDNKG